MVDDWRIIKSIKYERKIIAMGNSLQEILFLNGNKEVPGTPYKVGNTGPIGKHLSSARTSSAIGNKAKLNSLVFVLDEILKGKINAMEGESLIYLEFHADECLYQAVFDGTTIKSINSSIDSSLNHVIFMPALIPAVLYYTRANTEAKIARKDIKQYLENKDIGSLFLACDSIYYDTKKFTQEIKFEPKMSDELIKQSIRTGNLRPFSLFQEVGISVPDFVIDAIPPSASVEEEEEDDMNALYSDYKASQHVIHHEWKENQLSDIQPISFLDNFVPVPAFFSAASIIESNLKKVQKRMKQGSSGLQAIGQNYVNLQFVGRPATGKSTVANALSAALGLPIKVVINSKYTEEDNYQGMTKIQNGVPTFVETPFLEAYKNGGIILLEEWNLTDPGVIMGALGQAIEKPFILEEDGYRMVRRHPLCVIIATMNVGTNGSRKPSEAMVSRMPNIFVLDDPNESEFLKILQLNSGLALTKCKKVYRAYKKVIDYLCSSSISADDIALNVTMRSCLAALSQMEIGFPFKRAIKNTIIGAIAIQDLDLAHKVEKDVVDTLPD